MNKIITIVTPSYNQGSFIAETIESVLSQAGDFYIDYIIMDGGSTDTTIEIVKKYENLLKQQAEVKLIEGIPFYSSASANFQFRQCAGISYRWKSEKDQGQADAINKGISIAIGDVFAFLNSDDIYEPQAFTAISEHFNKNEKVDIVYGNAFYTNAAGMITGLYPTRDINQHDIHSYCLLCQPSVFIRTSVIKTAGNFNVHIWNSFDYEYWLRLYHKGFVFKYIRQVLSCSRMYSENKTSQNRKMIFLECIVLVEHYSGKPATHWKRKFTAELSPVARMLVKVESHLKKNRKRLINWSQLRFISSHSSKLKEIRIKFFPAAHLQNSNILSKTGDEDTI